MKAEVDHLVVAARTLAEGSQWCEATLGITPGTGGRHALMGTHNRLFSVASDAFPKAYFEIIAIDPDAPGPGRARWFGLDAIDLSSGPRLVNVVARVPALDAALASMRDAGLDGGRALAASRDTPAGRLSWRIAVRDDGATLCGGALPTLIEWGGRHPEAAMPASGVTLRSLTLRGVSPTLAPSNVAVVRDAGPALEACLDTPRGPVTLTTEGT
ncbi:MAG TPA: VOC family protein [Burkholderiaceae bacterium]|nr:VOC family protein [Burkholderiaceae bacterium]